MDRYSDLERRLGADRTRRMEPLARHATFRIGGPADLMCLPQTVEEVVTVVHWLSEHGAPWIVIGNGSNILFPDTGFAGVVIKIRGNTIASGTLWSMTRTDDRIQVGAGVSLARLARFSADAGLAGVEFATGIPGVVGGSIRGNAGAHGSQIGDHVECVEAVVPPGEITRIPVQKIGFGYRCTRFDSTTVITAAAFRLSPDRPKDIRSRIREYTEYRKHTQPSADQSAGCMFKNPPGESAGRLIDLAGCKGLQAGGAMVSEQHANFIVNRGGATATEVRALIETIRERVFRTSGIELVTEVRLLASEEI